MKHWPFSSDYQDWIDAIDGRDDFKAYTKTIEHNPFSTSEYIVFNYVSILADFQNPDQLDISDTERLHRSLRYNMRGAIFDAATKKLIRLPLHKFHNLNEKEQNQFANLDWSSYEVFDKMDGSMIAPFRVHGWNDIFWGSKMGVTHLTNDVKAFVDRNPSIAKLTSVCLFNGLTPIFEYVGNPLHRIVINYEQEKLVLLAIRENETGEYYSRDAMMNIVSAISAVPSEIPVVKKWDVDTEAKELIERIKDLKGEEGVVIQFPNDHRVKVKASDYVTLHKTRSAVETERFVALCVINETLDDLLPLVPDHVKSNLIEYARVFMEQYHIRLVDYIGQIHKAFAYAESFSVDNAMFENAKLENDRLVRKEFAMYNDIEQTAKWIGFKLIGTEYGDNLDEAIGEYFKDVLVKNCEGSESKFESEVRERIFQGKLMPWNIWMASADG